VAGALPRERLDDAVRRIIELKLRFRMEDDLDPALRARRLAAYPGLVAEHARMIAASLK
jgi:beta-glucosidase-like glycosyl hydrolase